MLSDYLYLIRQTILMTASKNQLKTTHSYTSFSFSFFVSLLIDWSTLLSWKFRLISIPASFAISSISFSLKYQKQKEEYFTEKSAFQIKTYFVDKYQKCNAEISLNNAIIFI